MTTTLSTYTQISNNLARWQTLTAKTPAVATATAYWNANIGKVKSADDLINNSRLFSYAMTAFGLSSMVSAKALIRQVLAQGVTSSTALANTLNNPNILAFAKTFDFAGSGANVMTTAATTTGVVSAYVEQSLETQQGTSDKGVQLALYFARNASKISNTYDILADKNLLTVVQTALGISSLTSAEDVDVQATNLEKQVNVADFSDPKKLATFVARFAAQYDAAQATNPSSSSTSAGLFGLTSTATNFGLSSDLLVSLHGLRLGG